MRNGPIGGPGDAGVGSGCAGGGGLGDGPRSNPGRAVDIIGPHLRITGRLDMGRFLRVTDVVYNAGGLFRVMEATVLRHDGQPSDLPMGDLWVSPAEVSVIAEMESHSEPRPKDFVVDKVPVALAVVTSGHTMTGRVFITPGASLEVFLESSEPQFLPMTELRIRSLIDRQAEAEYGFALVNRRHIIATSRAV